LPVSRGKKINPKWLIGLGMIFVICTFLCLVLEQQAGEVSIIEDTISKWKMMEFSNPITGLASIASGIGTLFVSIFKVLTWDYNFFTGYWVWARAVLITISFGIIVSFVLSFIKGTSST